MEASFAGFEPYKLIGVHTTSHVYGHGSYATVIELDYMGLKCAGKKIHELLLMQGNATYTVRKFEEECHILSRLRHPNVVQFLGVHFEKGAQVPILVMEFITFNLSNCIEQYGILPNEISYSILHDVAKGLCYLHNQVPPIIHRDLTSNNVLLTRDMTAKISDLGVAKILDLPCHQISQMTQIPGTPAFMPPEVMLAKPKDDKSVDIFSFGVMMIHVFSGKWPEPQVGPTCTEAGRLIPVSEAERREELLKIIGNVHPLMKLIHSCVHNDPIMRAHTSELVSSLGELVKMFPFSFANQIDVLKHIKRDQEIKQHMKEELQQRQQESLVQVMKLKNQIDLLKQQNCELIEQNKVLSSEKNDLVEQIARDEEAMISTIYLLKHTVEQKQQQFDDRSRSELNGLNILNQQSQSALLPNSDQKTDLATVIADTINSKSGIIVDLEVEKQISTQPISDTENQTSVLWSDSNAKHDTEKQPASDIVKDEKQISVQSASNTVGQHDTEKQTSPQPASDAAKPPENEKPSSSWITKGISKALGIFSPKSQVSIKFSCTILEDSTVKPSYIYPCIMEITYRLEFFCQEIFFQFCHLHLLHNYNIMATFTAFTKLHTTEYFCNAKVAQVGEIFVQQNFSNAVKVAIITTSWLRNH